jgi:RNA polymerase sigma factor (sigma-70 family)
MVSMMAQGSEAATAEPPALPVASFEDVYAGAHLGLLRFATLMAGGNRDVAEDAVAEVFARILHKRSWLGVEDVGAYLRRCVVNELRGRWRKEHRRSLVRARFHRGGRAGPDGEEETATDFASAADQRQRVIAAVAKLPAAQRAVIVLRLYEDRSEADTAAILGVPLGTVKSSFARARATLSTLLTEGEGS